MSLWRINPKTSSLKNENYRSFNKFFSQKEGFFFLKGKENLISLRQQREKYFAKKKAIAVKIANRLKIIPTIKMIAITGNLSMKNSDQNDDIDFLIICISGFLWTTRILATLFLDILGKRRKPRDSSFKNKICLNMYLDENHLKLPLKKQSLFSGHEIAQILPIYQKENLYKRFLKDNSWINTFLPGVKTNSQNPLPELKKGILALSVIENLLRKLQLKYMAKRKNETVTRDLIMFHPEDKTKFVLKEYNNRVEKYFT